MRTLSIRSYTIFYTLCFYPGLKPATIDCLTTAAALVVVCLQTPLMQLEIPIAGLLFFWFFLVFVLFFHFFLHTRDVSHSGGYMYRKLVITSGVLFTEQVSASWHGDACGCR